MNKKIGRGRGGMRPSRSLDVPLVALVVVTSFVMQVENVFVIRRLNQTQMKQGIPVMSCAKLGAHEQNGRTTREMYKINCNFINNC